MATTTRYATFSVGGLHLGVEVSWVQEVMRHHGSTHVPLAPAGVEGLINLRGEIVTAIDLRVRLGLEPRRETDKALCMVLRLDGGLTSVLVDEIGEVLNVDDDSFELPPDTLDPSSRELIVGAYKLEEALLLVLDVVAATTFAGAVT